MRGRAPSVARAVIVDNRQRRLERQKVAVQVADDPQRARGRSCRRPGSPDRRGRLGRCRTACRAPRPDRAILPCRSTMLRMRARMAAGSTALRTRLPGKSLTSTTGDGAGRGATVAGAASKAVVIVSQAEARHWTAGLPRPLELLGRVRSDQPGGGSSVFGRTGGIAGCTRCALALSGRLSPARLPRSASRPLPCWRAALNSAPAHGERHLTRRPSPGGRPRSGRPASEREAPSSVSPLTSVSLVVPGTGDTTHCRPELRSITHWRLSQNSPSGPNCRTSALPSSVRTPICSERPSGPSSSIPSDTIGSPAGRGAVVAGMTRVPAAVEVAARVAGLATSASHRGRSGTARSSAAVGRAAGIGRKAAVERGAHLGIARRRRHQPNKRGRLWRHRPARAGHTRPGPRSSRDDSQREARRASARR